MVTEHIKCNRPVECTGVHIQITERTGYCAEMVLLPAPEGPSIAIEIMLKNPFCSVFIAAGQ